MDINIKYTRTNFGNQFEDHRYQEAKRVEHLEGFIDDNIGTHLEEKIEMLTNLVIALTKIAVVSKAISANELADLLGAPGRDFEFEIL